MNTTLQRAFVVAGICGIFHIASAGSAIAQTDDRAIDGAPSGAAVRSAYDIPATPQVTLAHIRPRNPALAALIEQATERSATFRQLVETINHSAAIVYVQEGDCGHGVRACVRSVSAAGPYRLLWVHVDTRKQVDSHVMASIGHELRHAIEVIDDPSVTNNSAMFFLYQRIGSQGTEQGAVETGAAVAAGEAVRSEVRAFDQLLTVRRHVP